MKYYSFPASYDHSDMLSQSFIYLDPSKENYKFWERVVAGDAAVFSFKSSTLKVCCARIVGRGLAKSESSRFDGNAALILYIDDIKITEINTIDAYKILILSETKEITSTVFYNFEKLCNKKCSISESIPDDLFPYSVSIDIKVCLAQTKKDFEFVKWLAGSHPFGVSSGQYVLVTKIKGKNTAAVVIRTGRRNSKTHSAERRLFGLNLYALKEHSVHIGRLYSSAKNHLMHKHHADIISCIKYFARHLFNTPTTFISGVSYDYVPAAVAAGAMVEFPLNPLQSIYYWYPLFMNAEVDDPQNLNQIKNRYRKLKAARETSHYWFISTDQAKFKSSLDNKIWLLRDAPNNVSKWRVIEKGDPIFLSIGGDTVDAIATVAKISRESIRGYERFPLGVHFSEVSILQSPILIREETSKRWFSNIQTGGIFELPDEFALQIIEEIRSTERKSEMWVSPNPYLLQGRDFEAKPKNIFVVQAWSLKDTVLPVIREICEGKGYTVTHASDRQGQVIFEDIWILINEAEAVLVDFTHKRPNVYLEYGMALVLGKPIICITQNQEDLPSDTPQLKYILYPSGIEGSTLLVEKIPKALHDTIADFAALAEKEGRNQF